MQFKTIGELKGLLAQFDDAQEVSIETTTQHALNVKPLPVAPEAPVVPVEEPKIE